MQLDRRTTPWISLALAAVLFVTVNVVANSGLRGLSIDFTENSLFTLSGGTEQVLADIDEPLTLRFFFSADLGEDVPAFARYAGRVRELLQRYAALSGGKVRVEYYDPAPFSDAEDMAVGYGLQGVPVNRDGDLVFFGLAGTNSTDDEQAIIFFQQDRERFLEYDLTRMVADLAQPKKTVVGLLSGLPLTGAPGNPMTGGGRGSPPWMVLEQIGQTMDVRRLGVAAGEIPDDIDVLMIVHPKDFSERTRYAIDQYVLGGGRALVFVDPHSESDPAAQPMGGMPGRSDSGLPDLLAAWGVEVEADRIVGDRYGAVRVNAGGGQRIELVNFVAWINLEGDRLNRDDIVTGQLSRLTFASAGHITKREGAGIELVPLVRSSPDAMRIDAVKVRFFPDFKGLLSDFVSEDREFVLAARITGTVTTAFPDGPPKPEDGAEDGDDAKEAPAGLTESAGPVNLIVVADTDLLADRFWVQVQDFFGQRIASPVSGNADFVVNALDNLSGSNALIGLRSRGQSARPFTLVQRLQAEAEQQFRAKEQELQNKLKDTERKLSDLQTQESPAGASLILTDEQRQAIEDFRDEMLVIRKQLRGVQLALRQDIDRLESWLKFFNIGLIPIIIGLLAMALGLLRRNRRRHAYPGASGGA